MIPYKISIHIKTQCKLYQDMANVDLKIGLFYISIEFLVGFS